MEEILLKEVRGQAYKAAEELIERRVWRREIS